MAVFKRLEIEDLILVTLNVYKDERGYFTETYKESEFKKNGIKDNFIQDNCSFSKKNVLRGLHFQKPPYMQSKLIRCVKGAIIDVAIDIRKNSPTYGKYYSVVLSDKNNNMLYIPEGFAHGFLTLEDDTIVTYKVSGEYNPKAECGIIWNDPDININWENKDKPVLSKKDAIYTKLSEINKKDLP